MTRGGAPEDEERLLDALGTGPHVPPPDEFVSETLARLAGSQPSREAVRFRAERLTYAGLNQRVNQLAHLLASVGVGRGDRVVSCLEPSIDAVVVPFAILRAGAAYTPIDPTYPVARLNAMLVDIKPRVVLSTRSVLDRLRLDPALPLIALDEAAAAIAAAPAANGAHRPDATQPATIFHTSGTTGAPKGVVATHENVAHFAQVARQRYGITASDVIPAIARFTFSISIFELVVPICAGATVVVLDRDLIMDPRRLAHALEEVTLFHAGPSLLRAVLAEIRTWQPSPGRFDRVRHASSGGDMVPPQILTELRATFDQAEIYVIYGCSEISCMGCTYEVPVRGPIPRTYVGLPFARTRVKVLDDQRLPVPLGEVGEVWVAGTGVTAGYHNLPALTDERYVDIGGERFYRTGDVGRWIEDRGLELLGRSDFQVKIRGMRVECSDVEFHLRQMPGIREALVVGREFRGERVLAAFVVRLESASGTPTDDDLGTQVRRHLSELVPDYMVPAFVVELPALPLNHNLKVDRNALPALDDPRAARRGRADDPATDTERTLARIWSELLNESRIDRHQNFFELGGNSLMAAQAIVRIVMALDVEVDGMMLLREPLREVAAVCDQRLGRTGSVLPGGAATPPSTHRATAFYFGPRSELYGTCCLPAAGPVERAVLICAPVTAEYHRTAFVVARLQRRLAEAGAAAMRFDYFGTRDSLGEDYEGSPDRWREDILAAREELVARSGVTEVTAIGIHLGATLLLDVAAAAPWARIVVWDPVINGDRYADELEVVHRRSLQALRPARLWRRIPVVAGRRELVGFTFADSALAAMRQVGVARVDAPALGWLATSNVDAQRAFRDRFSSRTAQDRFVILDDDPAWTDPARTLDVLPDAGYVRTLVALAGGAV